MELRVFNKLGKVVSIHYENISSVTMVNRRLCYTIGFEMYYSARNLKDIGKLYEQEDMFQIDKNVVINLKHVDHLLKGDAYIKGKKYPVSRRRKPELRRKWNNMKK